MPQDLVLIIFFMGDNRCYQLILSLVSSPPNCQKLYKYVQDLKTSLENAFKRVNEFCAKEAARSKQIFDRTAKCSKLVPGDLVLVKKKGFASKHKIADRWETEPYEN